MTVYQSTLWLCVASSVVSWIMWKNGTVPHLITLIDFGVLWLVRIYHFDWIIMVVCYIKAITSFPSNLIGWALCVSSPIRVLYFLVGLLRFLIGQFGYYLSFIIFCEWGIVGFWCTMPHCFLAVKIVCCRWFFITGDYLHVVSHYFVRLHGLLPCSLGWIKILHFFWGSDFFPFFGKKLFAVADDSGTLFVCFVLSFSWKWWFP